MFIVVVLVLLRVVVGGVVGVVVVVVVHVCGLMLFCFGVVVVAVVVLFCYVLCWIDHVPQIRVDYRCRKIMIVCSSLSYFKTPIIDPYLECFV